MWLLDGFQLLDDAAAPTTTDEEEK